MATDVVDFISCLRELLEQERNEADPVLSADDISELLQEDEDVVDLEDKQQGIVGYPSRPFYKLIGVRLQAWMDNKECPLVELPTYDLLDEKSHVEQRVQLTETITPMLAQMASLWSMWSQGERCARLKEVIQKLGKRGLLDLLGLRRTVGTLDVWPPPRGILEATFSALNKAESGSSLTVGARALAKHCHRDQTSSWWGISTGKEEAKNAHAQAIMKKILDNATWINIHQMVHETKLVEARQENGYGVRWTLDGQEFRGFLEPQMENGHIVGWKH